MSGAFKVLQILSLALVVIGCGGNAKNDSAARAHGGSSSASGGSAQIGGGGSGGAGRETGGAGTKPCRLVDGKPSYGPIGEAHAWPPETVSAASGSCAICGVLQKSVGFRTPDGYGFLWSVGFDVNSPSPNLFELSTDSNFEAGEPRPLLARNSALQLDVASSPQGFVVTTCTPDAKPEWLLLNGSLEITGRLTPVAPGAACKYGAPPVLWTGERYLTTYIDERGLVVASFDEKATPVGEQIVSADVDGPVSTRFAKNADRVLFVFMPASTNQLQSGVFDLQGNPLLELQPFGEELEDSSQFAMLPRDDGWWVMSDSGAGDQVTAKLMAFSRDGRLLQTKREFGYFRMGSFDPSALGGSLLIGSRSEGGLFAHSFPAMHLIDEEGELVYSAEEDTAGSDGPWPSDVIVDPERDLVVESRAVQGSARRTVVQEYGCLD